MRDFLKSMLEIWISDFSGMKSISFSFLLLKSERDSSNWALLNSLHKMCGETSNLVSHSLGLNDSDVINDSLVEVEILGQFSVVLLDDGSGGSLDSLGSNSTHSWSCF